MMTILMMGMAILMSYNSPPAVLVSKLTILKTMMIKKKTILISYNTNPALSSVRTIIAIIIKPAREARGPEGPAR